MLDCGLARCVAWTAVVDSAYLQLFTVTCACLCFTRSVLASATWDDTLDFSARLYICIYVVEFIYTLQQSVRRRVQSPLEAPMSFYYYSDGPVWVVGVVRIDPFRFLARCCKIRFCLLISYCIFSVLLFITAPFYVSLICIGISSVFQLFWLNCQYLPSN